MKYLLCIFLLLPTISFSQEFPLPDILFQEKQVIFFDGTFYYNAQARRQYRQLIGLFEGTGGLGFKYHDKNMTALLNFEIGFSLEYGEGDRFGEQGTLNAEFSYRFKPIWEPFIILNNEYDTLAKLHWRNYTGAGLRIIAHEGDLVTVNFGVAPILHYEKYAQDNKHNVKAHDKLTMSYIFSGHIEYAFYPRLKLQNNWYVIPNYNFENCRVKAELSFIIALFRNYIRNRKTGGDYEMKVGIDHFTKPPTYFKQTDIHWSSGVKLFF